MPAPTSSTVCIPAVEGQPISDLNVSACLAAGGFATVFRGHGTSKGHRQGFAFKCVASDKKERGFVFASQSLLHEFNVLRGLNHRNIVTVHGLCVFPAKSFRLATPPLSRHGATALVLELCGGSSLHSKLYQHSVSVGRNTYTLKQAFEWALDIIAAIAYLHGRCNPIIHRDLKLENVLLAYEEHTGRFVAKVCDFGLSAHIHSETCCVHVASRLAFNKQTAVPRDTAALQRLMDSDAAMVKDPLTPSLSSLSFASDIPVGGRAPSVASSMMYPGDVLDGSGIAYAPPRSRAGSEHGVGVSFTVRDVASTEIPLDMQSSGGEITMIQEVCGIVASVPPLPAPRSASNLSALEHLRADIAASSPHLPRASSESPCFKEWEESDEFDMHFESNMLQARRRLNLHSLSRLSDVSERPTECANLTQQTVELNQTPFWDAQDNARDHASPTAADTRSSSSTSVELPLLDNKQQKSSDSANLHMPSMVSAVAPAETKTAPLERSRAPKRSDEHPGQPLTARLADQSLNVLDGARQSPPEALKIDDASASASSAHEQGKVSGPSCTAGGSWEHAQVFSGSHTTLCMTPSGMPIDHIPPASSVTATPRTKASASGSQGLLDIFQRLKRPSERNGSSESTNARAPGRSTSNGSMYKPPDLRSEGSKVTRAIGKILAKKTRHKVADRVLWRMTGGTGSLAYMAPEVLTGKAYNAKIDVFSYSVLLWELFSKTQVITRFNTEEGLHTWTRKVACGERLPFPDHFPDGLRKLIAAGWAQRPEDRPTAAEYLAGLSEWYQTEECEAYLAQERPSGFFSCFGCGL